MLSTAYIVPGGIKVVVVTFAIVVVLLDVVVVAFAMVVVLLGGGLKGFTDLTRRNPLPLLANEYVLESRLYDLTLPG
jgi:hypothetical protein